MNQDWSDDENIQEDEELVQPSRDFPISDNDDEEEEEYDMYELAKLTIKNKTVDEFFEVKEKIKNPEKNNSKNKNVIKQNEIKKPIEKKGIRKFNPRLPPPDKYNKTNKNSFNFNINDFPSL